MSPRLPFWVAAAMSLLNAMYGLFILPESLAPEKRQRAMQWVKANPVGALKLLRSHHELFGLAVVNFLAYLAHEIYATVWVLYSMYRYGWNEKAIGLSLAVVGIASMVTMAGLVGPPSQSMMTQRVSASEQGELQGAISSLRGLAMIFGPGIFSATFAACIAPGRAFPSGPWYLAAAILIVALGIAVKVTGGAVVGKSSGLAHEQVAS